jgi:hypothetical protein
VLGGEGAEDLFLSAAGGVPQDTFLTEDLLNLSDTASGECIWEAGVLVDCSSLQLEGFLRTPSSLSTSSTCLTLPQVSVSGRLGS